MGNALGGLRGRSNLASWAVAGTLAYYLWVKPVRELQKEQELITTVIFGTINGVIGIIASLPHDQYVFLEKLQSTLVKFIKGVGSLNHEQWRSFHNDKKTVEARNFLDGDLIESFLDLNRSKMEEASKAIGVSVDELSKRVEELTRLH